MARGREPVVAIVRVGVLEIEEGLAFGGFGWYELLFGGGGVVDADPFTGSTDVCPAFGIGDLDAFGLLGPSLSAGHDGRESERILVTGDLKGRKRTRGTW